MVWTVESDRTVSLYVDSGFEGDDNISETDMTYNNIGLGYSSTGYYWNGKIQDVRIYDRALSPEEINILYNITHPDENQRVMQSSSGVIYTKGQIEEL
ncbi:MAG: LamG-like jellyroll fold domain-containing protein [archaeon]